VVVTCVRGGDLVLMVVLVMALYLPRSQTILTAV
jgi:hypothetical protein